MKITLLSCVKTKLDRPAPAKELYISSFFQKQRAYADALGYPWFILSAKYGFLHPDHMIAPYESTLNTMTAQEQQKWAERVWQQMQFYFAKEGQSLANIIFLAGLSYRRNLGRLMAKKGINIHAPMDGMKMGHQLRFLSQGIISPS